MIICPENRARSRSIWDEKGGRSDTGSCGGVRCGDTGAFLGDWNSDDDDRAGYRQQLQRQTRTRYCRISRWWRSRYSLFTTIYLRRGGYLFARVCLSVCLSVNIVTQKLTIISLWNFVEWLDIIRGPIDHCGIDSEGSSPRVRK